MSVTPTDVAAALHVELPSALGLGQIVKARVLKHYEGGRYLVSLEGRERVVDSSVPLTTGELVRGRVIAVGDRIELQPLPGGSSAPEAENAEPGPPTDPLSASFAQFGLKLDDAARAVVMRSMKGAADPQGTLLAAVTLAKLGLPQQPGLIDAVQALLRRRPASSPAAEAAKEGLPLTPGPQLVTQLQEVLRTTLAPAQQQPAAAAAVPTQVSSDGADGQSGFQQGGSGTGSGSGQQLGQWVMNTQTGGAVAHRVGTLPLIVGGRLVEVDVALFEQDSRQSRQGEPRARHVVFVLDSAALGGVEVSARLVDSRLRLRFAADRDATLELLAGRREELSRQLAELGWTVDEIAYEPRQGNGHNAAYRTVADYVVSQGSLDRKI